MKRGILLALIALGMGAATNVFIAWWGAARTDILTFEHDWGQIQDDSSDLVLWLLRREHTLRSRIFTHARAKEHNYAVAGSQAFPRWSTARRVAIDWPAGAQRFMLPLAEDASGWPFRSMKYRILSTQRDGRTALVPFIGTYFVPERVDAGIRLHDRSEWSIWGGQSTDHEWMLIRALPLEPIWPGFAANTLIYAAALWAVGAVSVRSLHMMPFLRRRRGVCPRCVYDLRFAFAEGCPECGWNR